MLAGLPLSGCICGEPLIVDDIFVPVAPDERVAPGSLHTYASNAQVVLEVRSASSFLAIEDVTVLASGADVVTIDAEAPPALDGDKLTVTLRTGSAGEGSIVFVRDGGNETLSERVIAVADADAIALDVTAPGAPGIALPEVDPDNVRIFAGSKAAFRTTLTRAGDELFGLDSVVRTSSNAAVTTRNGTGCAEGACDRPRNAVEIAVPESVTDDVAVTLTSGEATVVVNVVPTTIDDVTSVESSVRDTSDLADGDRTAVVALVNAGDEPVFGAPLTWAVDDVPVENEEGDVVTGDAIELAFVAGADITVDAFLGERSIGVAVASDGSDVNVTSITAACSSGGAAATWPMVLVLALLALARPRRADGACPGFSPSTSVRPLFRRSRRPARR